MELDKRLLLALFVPPFHASTALEQVLMSSGQVSTLCPANVYQCESGRIVQDANGENVRNATNILQVLSGVWDLNKPVLLDKGPRRLGKVFGELADYKREGVPSTMQQLGIHNLGLAYMIMWRPPCLAALSSNGLQAIERDQEAFWRRELQFLHEAAEAYRHFDGLGIPTLVINQAHLMWKPLFTRNRLQHFVPCAGKFHMDSEPKLGRDIFDGNQWKVHEAVKDYGREHDPMECCGYDVETDTCASDQFNVLSEEEQQMAKEAMNFLSLRSTALPTEE